VTKKRVLKLTSPQKEQPKLSDQEKLEILSQLWKDSKKDYSVFVEKVLRIRMWSGMRMILDHVRLNKRVSIRACHGISKTFTAAVLAVTFFNLFPDCVVITTAPTGRQVKNLLWKEINGIYARNAINYDKGLVPIQLRGVCLTTQVNSNSNKFPDSYMIGFSTDKQSSVEGFHAAYIFWILDEAKGLPKWIYKALEGSLTGENAKVIELSTTDGADQQCAFRQHHNKKGDWSCIHLSAFDSPFVKAEEYPEYSKFRNKDLFKYGKPNKGSEWDVIDKDIIPISESAWIDDKITNWLGSDKPLFDMKVCGEFSEMSEDNLIPLAWVLSAVNAKVSEYGLVSYGLDVARYGSDKDVMCKRKNKKIMWIEKWGKIDTMQTLGKTLDLMDEEGQLCIDAIGVGAGVHDRVRELMLFAEGGIREGDLFKVRKLIGVDSSVSSVNELDGRKFFNFRAEIWWNIREMFRLQYEHGDSISIPDDAELIEELTTIRYHFHSNGKILVEKVEDFRKRVGRSPDTASSVIYSFVETPDDMDEDQNIEMERFELKESDEF